MACDCYTCGILFTARPVSYKRENESYPSLMFNKTKAQLTTSRKHLGLILDLKLDFTEHIDNKINKCNKIIGIMKRRSLILLRKSLLTIYTTESDFYCFGAG